MLVMLLLLHMLLVRLRLWWQRPTASTWVATTSTSTTTLSSTVPVSAPTGFAAALGTNITSTAASAQTGVVERADGSRIHTPFGSHGRLVLGRLCCMMLRLLQCRELETPCLVAGVNPPLPLSTILLSQFDENVHVVLCCNVRQLHLQCASRLVNGQGVLDQVDEVRQELLPVELMVQLFAVVLVEVECDMVLVDPNPFGVVHIPFPCFSKQKELVAKAQQRPILKGKSREEGLSVAYVADVLNRKNVSIRILGVGLLLLLAFGILGPFLDFLLHFLGFLLHELRLFLLPAFKQGLPLRHLRLKPLAWLQILDANSELSV
mmetsp:Transcript_27213/g.71646  ORF Transcript_27213/g.71646 Transcript_27213/m.71646 type:complete len:320 (-) Transcript_27213:2008-2967(-)